MERYFSPGCILHYGRKLGHAHERAPVLSQNEILVGLVISHNIHCHYPLDLISIISPDLSDEEQYTSYFQKVQEGAILSLELYALPRKYIESCPDGSALTLGYLLDLVRVLYQRVPSD